MEFGDNPDQDAGNKNRADQNSKDGTVGGSLTGNLDQRGAHGGALSGIPVGP